MQYALILSTWYIGLTKTDFVFWKVGILVLAAAAIALKDRPRMLLWLGVMLVSSLKSVDPKLSVLGAHEEWAWGFLPAVFLCLLTGYKTQGNWLKWLGVGLSAHCLLQRVNLDPLVRWNELPSGYATAYIGSHIDAGVMIAMASPVMGKWLPLGLAGLWASHSRSGMIGALFALCPARFRLWLLPLFIVPFFLQAPKDKARIELWKIAGKAWLEKPFLGHGPATYLYSFHKFKGEKIPKLMGPTYAQGHAHNDLLEALCTTGILGLLAYLWMVIPFLRNPSLLALFVALKFNPVGIETLACAALIAANGLQHYVKKS
jgi:O-antigen ligase